jgi:hypothetical protein
MHNFYNFVSFRHLPPFICVIYVSEALFKFGSMSSRTVRLHNRHGYYLEIRKTGEVVGTKSEDSMYRKSCLFISPLKLFFKYALL